MAERDPRFGGNIERANVGKQYSRAFPGGPPGVDVRYENYVAPWQVDYTRNIPQQTGTPNFGGPIGNVQTGTPNFRGPIGNVQTGTPNFRGGLGGLEQQQSKVNLMDLYDRLGGDINWNRLLRQMDERGIEYADMGGYGYDTDPYDDEYGPFIPDSVLEMDIFGTDYGPVDEYDFDRKRGYPGRKFGRGYKGPVYSARGGLMSLRR
tara:strand:+ start:252 stop:869 length:618 start_codon:yes stop_codon:yes gene_type:complete